MRTLIIVFGILFSAITSAESIMLGISQFSGHDFHPGENRVFEIPVTIGQPGVISLEIYSPDGDLVRTITDGKVYSPGEYVLEWDGMDQWGDVVPSESYIPVIRLNHDKEILSFDPRDDSGGEEADIKAILDNNGTISFSLDQPTRVLIRAGFKSGPMMKSIMNWVPLNTGVHVIHWNGYDEDNLIKLLNSGKMSLLVAGYKLPDYSIIVTGRTRNSYSEWNKKRYGSDEIPDMSKLAFSRNGVRVSRHYYLPRSVDIDPKVNLRITTSDGQQVRNLDGTEKDLLLKVDMDEEDQWALQQSMYEVAFFLDGQFLSEEEQGYVPLTWRWHPGKLKQGTHLVTVNVSGFNGQVGVKSLEVEVQ